MPVTPTPPSQTPADGESPRLAFVTAAALATARFPRGKVDGIAVRELFEAAMTLTAQPHPRLVVDLGGVALATSGLMGILVQLHKRFVQSGGRLSIAVPDARVRAAFEVARLHQLLHLHADPGAAARDALQ